MKEDIIRLLNAAKKKESETVVETKLSAKEFRALQILKECSQFQKLDAADKDRHAVRYYLDKLTNLTVNEGEILSRKVERMANAGQLDIGMKNLNESMADDLAADHEGEEHGMYGLDKGPKTPSGDADKGSGQKDDRGDDAAPKDKGYLDEEEGGPPPEVQAKIDAKKEASDDHECPMCGKSAEDCTCPGKAVKEDHYTGDGDEGGAAKQPIDKGVAEDEGPNYDATSPPIDAKEADTIPDEDVGAEITKTEAKLKALRERRQALKEDEVPKDAKSPDDKQTAAKDAKYKDGVMQNEAEGQDYQPKAKDPGEPSGGKGSDKPDPEKVGDVEDLPDYSTKAVKAEDPSHSELNKGPAKVTAFESIESRIVGMLEKAGFTPGTKEWENLYSKGFARAISERAKFLSKKLNEVRVPRNEKK